MTIQSCLIVGAGMAGLIAGSKLKAAGVEVTIIDKARGVGGRMATRRIQNGRYDHGAQYFTARDERFQAYVDEWLAVDALKIWSEGFLTADGSFKSTDQTRYIGADGMTSIPKYLVKANDLPVHLSQRAATISHNDGGWLIKTEQGKGFRADALLMTPPVDQTLTLFHTSKLSLPMTIQKSLEMIDYAPCLALMAQLDRPTKIPPPGGMWNPHKHVAWLADNYQKGISTDYGITLHATPQFTNRHWHVNQEEVTRILLHAAQPWLNDAKVINTSLQRWRYSQATVLYHKRYLGITNPAPLVLGGDAFGGARVEGAALSGMEAAEWLLEL